MAEFATFYAKCEECSDGTVDIGIGGKDRKAAVVYARPVYAEFLKQKAEDPRKAYLNDPTQFNEGPVHCTTVEAQGELRDIAGWVISEEIKACIAYVNQYKCSKSSKVADQVERNRRMKAVLNELKTTKIDILDGSKYPEMLEHAILYDKEGKTYVTDAVFEFFLQLSSLASTLLSNRNIHAFTKNVLSNAYTQILNNVKLKRPFQLLIENKIGNNDSNSGDETVLVSDIGVGESCGHEDALPCADNSSSHGLQVEDALTSDIGVGVLSYGHEDALPCADNSCSHDLEIEDALTSDTGVGVLSYGHEDALPCADNSSSHDLEIEDALASEIALEKESYEDALTSAGNM